MDYGRRNNKGKRRVAVGLSGGVDSSVAAVLLKKQGYDIVGLTMEIFDQSSPFQAQTRGHACYGPEEKEDVERARNLCKQLRIPFHALDLRKEYERHVLDYFRREYLSGRTPNPCIVCNKRLKFGFLLEKAKDAGIHLDAFATGHYARIEKRGTRYLLKRAADLSKDQSYFLWALERDQLSRALFPLGGMKKQQVREMARSLGLESANMPESQDLVSGGDYSALFTGTQVRPGEIVDESGQVLGRHQGIIYYTIGQRRGLGIASGHPLYVVDIDADKSRIVVGDRERVRSPGLLASRLNLILFERLEGPLEVKAKIRVQHREADARIVPLEGDRIKVLFKIPQMSVTPGQSVVFYVDDLVLGGAVIERALGRQEL